MNCSRGSCSYSRKGTLSGKIMWPLLRLNHKIETSPETLQNGKSMSNHHKHYKHFSWLFLFQTKSYRSSLRFQPCHCSRFHTGPRKHYWERWWCDGTFLTVFGEMNSQVFLPVYLPATPFSLP